MTPEVLKQVMSKTNEICEKHLSTFLKRPEKMPAKIMAVKCMCGECSTYGLSYGTFYQGSGWTKEEAEWIAEMLSIPE